jgi:hypothetical protein
VTRFRPLLCTVQDSKNFHDILAHAINSKIREASEHKFACVWTTPRPSVHRKLPEQTDPLVDRKGNSANGHRAATLFNVVADLGKIAGCG